MSFEKRDNSGALFKNDRREKDTHPHYKGDVLVNGVEYWLSAWVKQSSGGQSFMSLALTPKDGATSAGNSQPQMSDDLPF